jgi:predicted TIM-barrel fold metal-dependent hydrolase
VKIIDAHTHVFEYISGFGFRGELRPTGNGWARWGTGELCHLVPEGFGNKEFLPESLISIMDANGVEKSVLLQGSFYGFANEFIYETVKKYPQRFIGAGTFNPFCLDKDKIFERLIREMNFKIIKLEVSSGGGLMGFVGRFDMQGPVFSDCVEKINDSGAVFVIDIGSPGMESFQPEAVAAIAKKYPMMKIVICHLLAPVKNNHKELEKALKTLIMDNIWFDLAAMPANVAPEAYPYPTAREYLSIAKRMIGAEHMIWGTDTPSVLARDSYGHLVDYITLSGIFTDSELDKLFYDNAAAVYPF